MAPSYANLFTESFEQNLLRDYSQKTWIVTFGIVSFYLQYFLHIFVTRTHWIISFPLHRITVNPRT